MPKLTNRVFFCFRPRYRAVAAGAPAEIKSLFEDYAENDLMTVGNLRRFLTDIQKEANARVEDAESILKSLHELKHLKLNIFHRKSLDFQAFLKYLLGDSNPPIDPNLGVHHVMTDPLSHYYIYTGHNSYLTGNQVSSDCSDEPIIHALRNGVRVIELDIWPNSTKDDVYVLHGRTLTTPVQLIKCLRSIKENAFSASDYPVVITLEDHLTPDLQAKVAKMISQTFGDMLYRPGPEGLKEFPSPENLKKHVIISTKPPKEYLEAKDIGGDENELEGDKQSVDAGHWGREISDSKSRSHDLAEGEVEEGNEDDEVDHKSQQIAPPEYKHLIAIHAGKAKGGPDDWLRLDPNKVRRLSLSELELEKAAVTHAKEIVRFTQRNLLRVYPKGTRLDSSNYNPLIGWMHGAQMVALNMQGYAKPLWVMHGMFRANGGCGYVRKPDILLRTGQHNEVFDPRAKLPVKTTLKVTVYMGEGWYYDFRHTHFDSCSPPDFYARVGIAGVPADTTIMQETKILEDNWIPTWDEQFEFQLTVPELALLRIEVYEHDMTDKDDFGGQTCLPVAELREGIRAVPLHSEKGEIYKSTKLLMRFQFV